METEIMAVRLDGSGLKAIVPARKRIANANGYWTADGREILYMSQENEERRTRIRAIDPGSGEKRMITPVEPIPDALSMADPHGSADRIVFAVQTPYELDRISRLWTMGLDGSAPAPLTNMWIEPERDDGVLRRRGGPIQRLLDYRRRLKTSTRSARMMGGKRSFTNLRLVGDYDPKFSPDGSKVAFMRHFGNKNFHIMIIDVETREERDLSMGIAIDATPEWSSDGSRLIFWRVDFSNRENSGIWTALPDGTDRQRVPLPDGYIYSHPAFFPGEGSGPDARIVFSAWVRPQP